MASRLPHTDYDDSVIYASPKDVLHPGMVRQDRNEMSSLSGGVARLNLGGTQGVKKSLYRCDLQRKIEKEYCWTGLDIDGDEIFVGANVHIRVYNISSGSFVRDIKCNELKWAWDVKICDNMLYVTDIAEDKKVVLIMDKNGNIKSRIGLPGDEVGLGTNALSLAIDEITKDIYVSSWNTKNVYVCRHGSEHFVKFISSGLFGPVYICVGPCHQVILSDYGLTSDSHTVKKYSSEGELIWSFGEKGSNNRQLKQPWGICTDIWGNVYVADNYNNRVVHISSSGKFISNINIAQEITKPLAIVLKGDIMCITTGKQDDEVNENTIYVIKCQFA